MMYFFLFNPSHHHPLSIGVYKSQSNAMYINVDGESIVYPFECRESAVSG